MEDVPEDLAAAISHAQMIHSWQTNLPFDEMPPRYIWPFDTLLKEHFERVKAERDQRSGRGQSDTSTEASWEQNEFARGLR